MVRDGQGAIGKIVIEREHWEEDVWRESESNGSKSGHDVLQTCPNLNDVIGHD